MGVEYLGKVNNIVTVENLKNTIGMTQGSNFITGDINFLKFNDNGKIIYVADNVIYDMVSWNYLESLGMVAGKEISINGKKYICRLISGSNGDPNVVDDSEWKRLIVDLVPNKSDSNWNNSTMCKESLNSDSNMYAIRRGGDTVDYLMHFDKRSTFTTTGFRPVLEIVDIVVFPSFQYDLGEIATLSAFNYNANSLNGGNLNLVEKIDGKVIRTLNNQPGGEFSLRIEDFDLLTYGKHIIEIVATDITTNKDTIITSKFNKIKSPIQPIPTNSNLKQVMLHNKELKKEISYQNFRLGEKLKEKGIEIAENESLSSLISKVKIGKRWAEGTFTYTGNTSDAITSIPIEYGAQLDFNPSKIFLEFSASRFYVKDSSTNAECVGLNYVFCNPFKTDLYAIYSNYRYSFTGTISNITGSSFALIFSRSVAVQNASLKWYAFE